MKRFHFQTLSLHRSPVAGGQKNDLFPHPAGPDTVVYNLTAFGATVSVNTVGTVVVCHSKSPLHTSLSSPFFTRMLQDCSFFQGCRCSEKFYASGTYITSGVGFSSKTVCFILKTCQTIVRSPLASQWCW